MATEKKSIPANNGYIIGEKATWYLVSEEEYQTLDEETLDANKGYAILEDKSATLYRLTGYGTGATLEEWKEEESIDTNPATTAAQNAVINAVMGLIANKDFYFYLLEEGYIYLPWFGAGDVDLAKTITSTQGFVPPAKWLENIRDSIKGKTSSTVFGTFPIHGLPEATMGGIYKRPEIDIPIQYGTIYTPKKECSIKSQGGGYSDVWTDAPCPNQGSLQLPNWVSPKRDWKVLQETDTPYGAYVAAEFLTNTGGTAYIYKADFYVWLWAVKDFLLSLGGIISHSPELALMMATTGLDKEEAPSWKVDEDEVGGVKAPNPNEPDSSDLVGLFKALKGIGSGKTKEQIKKIVGGLSKEGKQYVNVLTKLLGDGGSYDRAPDRAPGSRGGSGFEGLGPAVSVTDIISTGAQGKEWSTFFKEYNVPLEETIAEGTSPFAIQNTYPNATHYVSLRGTTGKPPQLKTTLEVKNMPVKGKANAGLLTKGDAVIVKKEFIGENGEWHQIRVLQAESPLAHPKKTYYVNSKFLAKLPQTPYSLNRTYKCQNQKRLKPPDWTKMRDKEVFFDKGKCNQCIVIEPINPKTNKKYIKIAANELEEAKQLALVVGIANLLKFYNKKEFDASSLKAHHQQYVNVGEDNITPEQINTIDKILGAFQGPYVSTNAWYLDKRPGSKLKILVRFPSKYFDAIPETPEDFRGIPYTSTATLTPDPSDKEVAFVKDIYGLRTVHFVLPTLKEKINIISKLMEFYAKKMDSWLGTIPGLDLRREKQRLEDFPLVLFQFLHLNGFTVDEKEEDTIELGFNGIFELQYVLINKTGFASPLRIGFEQFKNKEPISITRTMAYVFYLDDLIREARKKPCSKIGWVEFVQKYTFPIPEIKPSSVASAIDSICAGTKGTKKEFSEKISKAYDKIETYTSKGMEAAQKQLNNPNLKSELINIRKSSVDFVGDEFVRQIPDLLKKLDSIPLNLDGLNELYSYILNKTDIKNLASMAASAVASKMSSTDALVTLGEFALEKVNQEELTKLYDSFTGSTKTKINDRMQEIDLGIDIESPDSSFSEIEKYKKPEASPFQKAIIDNSEIDSKLLDLEEKFDQPLGKLKDAITSLVEYEIVPSSEFLDSMETAIPDYKAKYACQDLTPPEPPNIPEASKAPSTPDMPSLDVSKLDVEMPSLKLPFVPSITIPDVGKELMKLADTMSDVGEKIKNLLEPVACESLLEIVKAVLESVFDSLFPSAEPAKDSSATTYGAKNLNTMFESSAGPFSAQGQCGVDKAFEELGIPTEIFLDFDPDNAPAQNSTSPGSVKTMIDDISATLTPLEIVDLLEGKAKPETIKVVEDTIANGYPAYMLRLKETTNIADTFSNLGKYVDPKIINSIKKAAIVYPNPGSGLLCEDEKREEEREIAELQQRLGGSTSAAARELAKEQIKRRRRRARQKLKKLLSVAHDADNVLKDLFPPTVNTCGEKVTNLSDTGTGVLSGVGGLLPKNHESMKYMNKKVVKNMFAIPNMHFNTEVNTYLDSLLKGKFRTPEPQDDQYKGFLSSLKAAGLEEKDIPAGLANQLKSTNELPEDDPGAQSKFNEVLTTNQTLSTQVAPDVKKSFLNPNNFYVSNYIALGMKLSYEKAKETYFVDNSASLAKLAENKEKVKELTSEIAQLALKQKDNNNKLKMKLQVNPATAPDIIVLENSKLVIEKEMGEKESNLQKAQEAYDESIHDMAPPEGSTHPTMTIADAKVFYQNDPASWPMENNHHFSVLSNAASMLNTSEKVIIECTGPPIPPLAEVDDYPLSTTNPAPGRGPWTWQEETFANYMIKRWEETPLPSPDFDANIFSSFYKNKQMLIFADLVRKLISFVPKSRLFSVNELADLELANDENDPETTSSPCPSPLRPGLLDINRYQEVVNNLYDEACEDVSKKPSNTSTLETSGIQGITYTTIRLYVLEALLKSIFTFSKFSFSELRGDTLYTETLVKSVMFGLRALDDEYYNDVLKQAKIITDKRQEKGEKLFNPLSMYTEESEQDETLGDPNDPRTLSGISSLRFLIKEQIFLLATEMDGRLKPPVKNLDSFFLGVDGSPSLVPIWHTPTHRNENRTEELIIPSAWSTGTTPGWLPNIHGMRKEWLPILDGDSGGFILEKYIRLEDADTVTVATGQDTFYDEFFEEWIERPGGSKHPLEVIHNKDEDPPNRPIDTGLLAAERVRQRRIREQGHLSGVVNIGALKTYLESIAPKWGTFNLKNVLKKFKFGIRLCYVPPTQKDGELLESQGQDSFESQFYWLVDEDELHPGTRAGSSGPGDGLSGKDEIYNNSVIEKTYWLDEYYEYMRSTVVGQESVESGEGINFGGYAAGSGPLGGTVEGTTVGTGFVEQTPVWGDIVDETLSRTIYPVPIITVEDSAGLDSLPELTVNDAIALLSSKASNVAFNGLKKQMIKTPKYQFLFNYIFPLPRMLSLVSIYNILSVSKNVNGAENMFSMTKDSFKSMFYILTPEDPWYSKQDKKHEAEGDNIGMMQKDNNSMTMTGPSALPSAGKIAWRAALILLKASARQFDAHYSLVSRFDDIGAAPFGMTWGTVPIFWPVNFSIPPIPGWGPVLGPIGMAAYSIGLLPGEKKKKKKREAQKAIGEGKTCVEGSSEMIFEIEAGETEATTLKIESGVASPEDFE